MTKLIALFGLTLTTLSHAATLAPGETLNINGTAISCQASTAEKCTLANPNDSCTKGAVKIVLNGTELTACEWLKDAVVELKNLRDAGACN